MLFKKTAITVVCASICGGGIILAKAVLDHGTAEIEAFWRYQPHSNLSDREIDEITGNIEDRSVFTAIFVIFLSLMMATTICDYYLSRSRQQKRLDIKPTLKRRRDDVPKPWDINLPDKPAFLRPEDVQKAKGADSLPKEPAYRRMGVKKIVTIDVGPAHKGPTKPS